MSFQWWFKPSALSTLSGGSEKSQAELLRKTVKLSFLFDSNEKLMDFALC
jgi:hypothetical protein